MACCAGLEVLMVGVACRDMIGRDGSVRGSVK